MIGAASHIASRTSASVVGPSEAARLDERVIHCHHRGTRSAEVKMRTWHRIGLIVLGLIVLFVGLAAWSIEDTYGHGLDFTLRGRNVYEADVDDPVLGDHLRNTRLHGASTGRGREELPGAGADHRARGHSGDRRVLSLAEAAGRMTPEPFR
jgi:hypothetical protein